LALAMGLAAASLPGWGRDLPEHQVKAAFLFNFAAFVKWPDEAFPDSATPLRYCVVRQGQVGQTLRRLIDGESLDGRSLELVELSPGQSTTGCHLLFCGADGQCLDMPGARSGLLLIVGDGDDFLEQGGMVALLRKRNRVHPVINLDALDASSLRLSSKLLRLATRVRPGGEEKRHAE